MNSKIFNGSIALLISGAIVLAGGTIGKDSSINTFSFADAISILGLALLILGLILLIISFLKKDH